MINRKLIGLSAMGILANLPAAAHDIEIEIEHGKAAPRKHRQTSNIVSSPAISPDVETRQIRRARERREAKNGAIN